MNRRDRQRLAINRCCADTQGVDNGSLLGYRAVVHQASGMVSVQAACTCAEAIDLMKDRASVESLTLEQVAAGVLDRSIQFGA